MAGEQFVITDGYATQFANDDAGRAIGHGCRCLTGQAAGQQASEDGDDSIVRTADIQYLAGLRRAVMHACFVEQQYSFSRAGQQQGAQTQ